MDSIDDDKEPDVNQSTTVSPKPSRRYFCQWCPDSLVFTGADMLEEELRAPDGEARCGDCNEVFSGFDAYECPICLDWAAAEDLHLFRERHGCFAPVPAGNGGGHGVG